LNLQSLIGFRSRQNQSEELAVPKAARNALALCGAVLSERGEVSGVRLAGECLQAWQSLKPDELASFLHLLANEYSPDPAKAFQAAEAYRNDPCPANLALLIETVEPPRQELFRRLNAVPGGTKALVSMRRHLLAHAEAFPLWAPIEADLEHLLASWFNRGFLSLRRIDWRTPAIVLEKLIQYEAVHQIQGWTDLRRRLEADRRCYAFFHQALGDEPIIFVEVALTRGMSGKVQPLLDADSPVLDIASANCAMFYSITNCQEGLRGIPFGNFLIKQVAEDLGKELRQIKTFATLSPVPLFRDWIETTVHDEKGKQDAKLAELSSHLAKPDWTKDKKTSDELKKEIEPLCAHYLLNVKQGQEPHDPVARFHLRNGARLERVNWLGDTSPAGLQRSAGMMVNYVYRLDDVERNHESYMNEYQVAVSRDVAALAKRSLLERDHARTKPMPNVPAVPVAE
jgi:malonyl-CoA decarboxylase